MGALWHPFSDMGAVERDGEFVIARGEGAYVFDADGTRYLDATAGLWFTNVGHGRAELAEAAAEQMSKVAAYSTFGDYATEPTVALAERLAGIAPGAGQQGLLHLRRLGLGRHRGQAGPPLLERGRPAVTTHRPRPAEGLPRHALRRDRAGRHPRQPRGLRRAGARRRAPSPGTTRDDLRATIERLGAEQRRRLLLRAGDRRRRRLSRRPTAISPTSARSARSTTSCSSPTRSSPATAGSAARGSPAARFGLEPDMITTAKGLTSGYLPMGAVLISPKVSEPFFQPDAGVWWRHGYTYSGHAAAAAVALANLDIIEREDLLDEAARLETTLADELAPLADHDASPRSAAVPAPSRRSSSATRRPRWRWPRRCARTASPPGRSAPAASRSRRRS